MKKITYVVIGCVILIVALTLYLNTSKGSQLKSLVQLGTQTPAVINTSSTTPFMVPFEYTVKSINASQVVLDGQRGELTLPNDASSIKVYKGLTENQTSNLASLKVGQKVKVELTPGKSAKVFIIQ